jgi:hypothetical protein
MRRAPQRPDPAQERGEVVVAGAHNGAKKEARAISLDNANAGVRERRCIVPHFHQPHDGQYPQVVLIDWRPRQPIALDIP